MKKILFYFLHLVFPSYYCSIDLKRQSELSGLRPDTSSLVYLRTYVQSSLTIWNGRKDLISKYLHLKRAAKFHGVLAMRFHLVVNVVKFTVSGIFIANNLLVWLFQVITSYLSFIEDTHYELSLGLLMNSALEWKLKTIYGIILFII